MNNHALKDYHEAVGLITKDFDYIPCKNISDSPKDTFILDPAALVEHDENLGFFILILETKRFQVKKIKRVQISRV